MASKCPKCEKMMTYIRGDTMDIKVGSASYKGVTYSCPYCFNAISVQMDPIALKADTVSGVAKALGR